MDSAISICARILSLSVVFLAFQAGTDAGIGDKSRASASVKDLQCGSKRKGATQEKPHAANAWHNFVPLQSTRREVEAALGAPQMFHGSTQIYKTDKERIDVLYSTGSCMLSGVERWNVPKDV